MQYLREKFEKQYGSRGIKVNDEICYCYYCKGGDKLNLEKSHVRIYETDLDRILVYTLKRLFLSFHQEDKGLRLKTYLEKVSAENENGNGIDTDTQFKTLYYDLFSKELSEKVRGAAKQIKSQGKIRTGQHLLDILKILKINIILLLIKRQIL